MAFLADVISWSVDNSILIFKVEMSKNSEHLRGTSANNLQALITVSLNTAVLSHAKSVSASNSDHFEIYTLSFKEETNCKFPVDARLLCSKAPVTAAMQERDKIDTLLCSHVFPSVIQDERQNNALIRTSHGRFLTHSPRQCVTINDHPNTFSDTEPLKFII
jgi:hypothetical protein